MDTGASLGVGEALAYEFAMRGASFMLSARSQSNLEQVQTQCKSIGASDVSIVLLDLEDCEPVLAIGSEAVSALCILQEWDSAY